MGYPGTCNLVRELEQVRQNMRHTWHTAEAETRTGSTVKVLSRLFSFLSKFQICLLEIFSSPLRSNKREREREGGQIYLDADGETGQEGRFLGRALTGRRAAIGRHWEMISFGPPSLTTCNLSWFFLLLGAVGYQLRTSYNRVWCDISFTSEGIVLPSWHTTNFIDFCKYMLIVNLIPTKWSTQVETRS